MNSIKKYLCLTYFLIFVFAIAVKADGFIVITQPGFQAFPLEVTFHNVKVNIFNNVATTSIEQEFYNPSARQMEGYYLFPIPEGAVINEFKMEINGVLTEAELLDAKKAKQLYEDIVRKMKDPALLEYSERGLFKVRIFPIEPRSKKFVTISYNEILNKDYDFYEYVYPLNTEKFSSAPLKNVSITTNIQTAEELKTVYCPTHNTEIIRKDKNRAIVSYEEENIKPDSDFKLYFNSSPSLINISLLPYRKNSEDGYFLLNISPTFDFSPSDILEKDITFVLDNSGSMAGKKLDHAKNALTYCLENLNNNDRFEVITFSTEVNSLFKNLVAADKENITKAKQFVSDLKSVGGTNIEEALLTAIQTEAKNERPHIIIFITDGKPTIGETNQDQILQLIKRENTASNRIFTFGIGTEINTHLLDKITELTHASRTYIAPDEDIEIKISGFYNKVQYPVLTDLKLEVNGKTELKSIYPKDISDLFVGTDITLLGKYKIPGSVEIELTGKISGSEKKFVSKITLPKEDLSHDFIPQLWAARRIGFLLDQIRLNGEDKELVDEIVLLAREYGIITPYTSYLILEDEDVRTARNDLPADFQTLEGVVSRKASDREILKEEFYSFAEADGAKSIQNSEELQVLSNVKKLPQTSQGMSRINFSENSKSQNIVQQRQGRAFYLNSNTWIDSRLQNRKAGSEERIQFASKEYFELTHEKDLNDYLSLGKNIRFVHNNTLYEIYE